MLAIIFVLLSMMSSVNSLSPGESIGYIVLDADFYVDIDMTIHSQSGSYANALYVSSNSAPGTDLTGGRLSERIMTVYIPNTGAPNNIHVSVGNGEGGEFACGFSPTIGTRFILRAVSTSSNIILYENGVQRCIIAVSGTMHRTSDLRTIFASQPDGSTPADVTLHSVDFYYTGGAQIPTSAPTPFPTVSPTLPTPIPTQSPTLTGLVAGNIYDTYLWAQDFSIEVELTIHNETDEWTNVLAVLNNDDGTDTTSERIATFFVSPLGYNVGTIIHVSVGTSTSNLQCHVFFTHGETMLIKVESRSDSIIFYKNNNPECTDAVVGTLNRPSVPRPLYLSAPMWAVANASVHSVSVNYLSGQSNTQAPTVSPTKSPTGSPTTNPTNNPTQTPTMSPTGAPTRMPTTSPTTSPSITPTGHPTSAPTESPTVSPTNSPTTPPTPPTPIPTDAPTGSPTTNAYKSDPIYLYAAVGVVCSTMLLMGVAMFAIEPR